ncbi:hypothetical protein D3C84_799080 [compost metagenome]
MQAAFIGLVAEQPVAQATHGQVADGGKSLLVMGVDDQPGDFIGFIGNQRFFEKMLERDIGKGHLCGNALAIVACGDAGEEIARAGRAGLGHHVLEAVEAVGLGTDAVGKRGHVQAPLSINSQTALRRLALDFQCNGHRQAPCQGGRSHPGRYCVGRA